MCLQRPVFLVGLITPWPRVGCTNLIFQKDPIRSYNSQQLGTDFALTHLVCSHEKRQVPFGFSLFPLPTEISSWLTCLLWNQASNKQWLKEQTRSKLSRGIDSNNTFHPLESNPTGSSTDSPAIKNTEFSELLLQHSEKVDSVIRECLTQNPIPIGPPWIAWLRPSSWLTGLTHDSMQTQTLHSF